jgi:hypothetical protein
LVFGTYTADKIDESIKEDVLRLRSSSILKGIEVVGFKLVTETGEVIKIDL